MFFERFFSHQKKMCEMCIPSNLPFSRDEFFFFAVIFVLCVFVCFSRAPVPPARGSPPRGPGHETQSPRPPALPQAVVAALAAHALQALEGPESPVSAAAAVLGRGRPSAAVPLRAVQKAPGFLFTQKTSRGGGSGWVRCETAPGGGGSCARLGGLGGPPGAGRKMQPEKDTPGECLVV